VKVSKIILLALLISFCSNSEDVNSSIPESNTETYSSVKTFEDLPNAVVRIVVKSTQVELNSDLELETFSIESSGSGFFINNQGYILTNNHVISGSVTIEVFTEYRDNPYTARIVGLSECDDIAVLKIDIENEHFLSFADRKPILGEDIIAVGFPKGDESVTFLDGIVSKKETDGSTSWASIDYAFEHTAEILPGSSGGPIVDKNVEVIGIAYSGNIDRQEFGIPYEEVKNTINLILENKFQTTLNANLEQFDGAGIYVYSLESSSPLRKVGFKGGEIITHIQDMSIESENTLKVYCDAIKTRTENFGIKLKGISLDDLSEFEVEVSLDGSVANIISSNIYAGNETTTTTTKPRQTTTTTKPRQTTTTTKPEKECNPSKNWSECPINIYEGELVNAPSVNFEKPEIIEIKADVTGQELKYEVFLLSSEEPTNVIITSIACDDLNKTSECIEVSKKSDNSTRYTQSGGNEAMCSVKNNPGGMVNSASINKTSTNSDGRSLYKIVCNKYEPYKNDFGFIVLSVQINYKYFSKYGLKEFPDTYDVYGDGDGWWFEDKDSLVQIKYSFVDGKNYFSFGCEAVFNGWSSSESFKTIWMQWTNDLGYRYRLPKNFNINKNGCSSFDKSGIKFNENIINQSTVLSFSP
tara:strand:- start:1421 stop:3343 length:1923 start_codon:yes stop_codon:yes gene_type:complete